MSIIGREKRSNAHRNKKIPYRSMRRFLGQDNTTRSSIKAHRTMGSRNGQFMAQKQGKSQLSKEFQALASTSRKALSPLALQSFAGAIEFQIEKNAKSLVLQNTGPTSRRFRRLDFQLAKAKGTWKSSR